MRLSSLCSTHGLLDLAMLPLWMFSHIHCVWKVCLVPTRTYIHIDFMLAIGKNFKQQNHCCTKLQIVDNGATGL